MQGIVQAVMRLYRRGDLLPSNWNIFCRCVMPAWPHRSRRGDETAGARFGGSAGPVAESDARHSPGFHRPFPPSALPHRRFRRGIDRGRRHARRHAHHPRGVGTGRPRRRRLSAVRAAARAILMTRAAERGEAAAARVDAAVEWLRTRRIEVTVSDAGTANHRRPCRGCAARSRRVCRRGRGRRRAHASNGERGADTAHGVVAVLPGRGRDRRDHRRDRPARHVLVPDAPERPRPWRHEVSDLRDGPGPDCAAPRGRVPARRGRAALRPTGAAPPD